MTFKIVHGLVDLDFNDYFSFCDNQTRGHSLKLFVERSRIDVREYSFCNRVIPVRNSLPQVLVSSQSVTAFKDALFRYDLSTFIRGTALQPADGPLQYILMYAYLIG